MVFAALLRSDRSSYRRRVSCALFDIATRQIAPSLAAIAKHLAARQANHCRTPTYSSVSTVLLISSSFLVRFHRNSVAQPSTSPSASAPFSRARFRSSDIAFSDFRHCFAPLTIYSMIFVGSRSQHHRVHSYRPRVVVLQQRIIGSPHSLSISLPCTRAVRNLSPFVPISQEPELLYLARRRVDIAASYIADSYIGAHRYRLHRLSTSPISISLIAHRNSYIGALPTFLLPS